MPTLMHRVLYTVAVVLSILRNLPFVGRFINVYTALLATFLRGGAGTWVAKGIERCKRPVKPLKLYEFEGCPFCRKVRETLAVLDLDAIIYPCPRETLKAYGVCEKSRFRPDVTRLGGKQTFPFLVDENTGVAMNESSEIDAYLWKTYGEGAEPPLGYKIGRYLNRMPFMMLPALCRPLTTDGMLRIPSKAPKEPLVLWGFEASPFVRLVREALAVLELPYLHRTIAHGALAKREEFTAKYGSRLSVVRQKAGVVQVPFLIDPNTGAELFESADIVEYLFKTYQDGPVSTETWLDYGSAQSAVSSAPKPAVKAD